MCTQIRPGIFSTVELKVNLDPSQIGQNPMPWLGRGFLCRVHEVMFADTLHDGKTATGFGLARNLMGGHR